MTEGKEVRKISLRKVNQPIKNKTKKQNEANNDFFIHLNKKTV